MDQYDSDDEPVDLIIGELKRKFDDAWDQLQHHENIMKKLKRTKSSTQEEVKVELQKLRNATLKSSDIKSDSLEKYGSYKSISDGSLSVKEFLVANPALSVGKLVDDLLKSGYGDMFLWLAIALIAMPEFRFEDSETFLEEILRRCAWNPEKVSILIHCFEASPQLTPSIVFSKVAELPWMGIGVEFWRFVLSFPDVNVNKIFYKSNILYKDLVWHDLLFKFPKELAVMLLQNPKLDINDRDKSGLTLLHKWIGLKKNNASQNYICNCLFEILRVSSNF